MLPFFNLFSSNPLKFLIFQAVEVAAGEVAFRLHPGPGHLPEGTETGSTEGEGCHQVSQPISLLVPSRGHRGRQHRKRRMSSGQSAY